MKLNPYLFNYTSNNRIQYCKACPRIRQPIILDKNPNDINNYNKDSYGNVLEYSVNNKTHYYISPDAWCPKCEKPFSYNDVSNTVVTKIGINGRCVVAMCPDSEKRTS